MAKRKRAPTQDDYNKRVRPIVEWIAANDMKEQLLFTITDSEGEERSFYYGDIVRYYARQGMY